MDDYRKLQDAKEKLIDRLSNLHGSIINAIDQMNKEAEKYIRQEITIVSRNIEEIDRKLDARQKEVE